MRRHIRLVLVPALLVALTTHSPIHAAEHTTDPGRSKCVTAPRSEGRRAEEEVRCVLGVYVEATSRADGQYARSIFHPDARMSGEIDGTARTGSPEPFFKSLEDARSAPGESGYEAEVRSIQVLGNTAIGDIAEENLFGYNFTNRFHLIRLDGRWQIVSKLYVGSSRSHEERRSNP